MANLEMDTKDLEKVAGGSMIYARDFSAVIMYKKNPAGKAGFFYNS